MSKYMVADLQPVDSGTDFVHDARKIRGRDQRKVVRHAVLEHSAEDCVVEGVYAAGLHLHADLAFGWFRCRYLLHGARSAEFVQGKSAHLLSSPRSERLDSCSLNYTVG